MTNTNWWVFIPAPGVFLSRIQAVLLQIRYGFHLLDHFSPLIHSEDQGNSHMALGTNWDILSCWVIPRIPTLPYTWALVVVNKIELELILCTSNLLSPSISPFFLSSNKAREKNVQMTLSKRLGH